MAFATKKGRQVTYEKADGEPGKSALVKEAKWWQLLFLFVYQLLHL